MSKSLAIKWIVIIVILLGSMALIYPNYRWYSKPAAEREKLESLGDKPQRLLNLGLDLRGGSSLAWMQEMMKRQQEEGIPAAKQPQRRTLKDFIADINNADQNNEIIVDIAALSDPDMMAQQQDAGFAAALQGTPAKQKTTMNFIVDGTADIMVDVID